jgi:hypothetical protein
MKNDLRIREFVDLLICRFADLLMREVLRMEWGVN